MKVKELIKKLESLNPDAEVIGRGYEGGFDSIVGAKYIDIQWKSNIDEDGHKIHVYEGAHEEWYDEQDGLKTVCVLVR